LEKIFDNRPSRSSFKCKPAAVVDEITLYLSEATVEVDNGIKWWYENKETYPQLFQMARDYLMIPGTFLVIVLIRISLILLVTQPRLSTLSGFSAAVV
jgi:hypothetical protein